MADLVEEKKHARLSPSASKRWMTCTGSTQLIESLNIQDKPSKFAAEGTVAHEVGELCLRNHKEPKEYLGKTIEADGMKFTVNQNMVDAVTEYTDYVREYIWSADTEADCYVELQVEVRSCLKFLGLTGLDGGTSDTVMINKEHQTVHIVDYKHGQGVAVEADYNTQAMCYALGVLNNLGIKAGEKHPWEVVIVIVQPRAHHPKGGIREWVIGSNELWDWANKELIPAAKANFDGTGELVPSDGGCRFCPAAGTCPKLYEQTQNTAMVDFADDEPTLPDPTTLTPEQKAHIIEHADMLRSFIVAVEEQVRDEVNKGSADYKEKFKLVRGATRRKFTEDAFDEDFSPLLDHLESEDLYERKQKGITEIEKTLKAKLKEAGIKGFTKVAKEIMDDITFKPEGKLVIAPLSDKRLEVQPEVVSDFTGLDK